MGIPQFPLPLTPEEEEILRKKGTEAPFSGRYWNLFQPGHYHCRACGAHLYQSGAKFRADCGWPAFDAEVPGAVGYAPDPDGRRTEIHCAHCGGHLGHVFLGEGFTTKNVRHCVNSASLSFKPQSESDPEPETPGPRPEAPRLEEAFFAGGCFWGIEHFFRQAPGVLAALSGYSGGAKANPTYEEVAGGQTGHAETVKVFFNPGQVSYEELARLFFEIHDPGQHNRQGPDVGNQYRSAVFYGNENQKATAEKLVAMLREKGHPVVTEISPAGPFYAAEDYHQDYLGKHPERGCSHQRVKRF